MASNRGLLLINLGSPDAPATPEVRRYLQEFLNDPYVIDVPTPFRQLLVYGVIAPTRAAKSAEAYAKVWRREGSPLVHYTRSFADKVAAKLSENWDVRWGMRYGSPSLKDACADWDVSEVLIVPLYPQYAESSTRTAIEAARRALGPRLGTRVLEDFYAREEFLASQALVIQRELEAYRPDHLLLSFHGLPEHHLSKLHPAHCFQSPNCCDRMGPENSKCYRAQCVHTAGELKLRVRFPAEKITLSFQSRLGRRPWIKPYTDVVVDELARQGVRKLAVSCPSFVADCLETLEEVQMRLEEQFVSAGGESLKLIPALNDDEVWVRNFAELIETFHE